MMTFHIGRHAQDIIDIAKGKRKNRIELAEHMWLKGFHKIIDGACLNPMKVKENLDEIALNTKPFTMLNSGSFLLANRQLLEQRKLFCVHLPIEEAHHLLFYLVKLNEEMFEFFYDPPGKCCKVLEPYKFPHFELRQSVDLSGHMDQPGVIMYDNSVSIFHQDWGVITKSYKSLKDFVEKTRV